MRVNLKTQAELTLSVLPLKQKLTRPRCHIHRANRSCGSREFSAKIFAIKAK